MQLRVPPGLQAETADVWIPALSELAWRIRAERPGRYRVEVQLGNETLAKEVRVVDGLARLSPVRQQPSFGGQLLYPVESPLPESQRIRSIHVTYATRDVSIFGWRLPWVIVFFLLVTAFALLLMNRFRVQ